MLLARNAYGFWDITQLDTGLEGDLCLDISGEIFLQCHNMHIGVIRVVESLKIPLLSCHGVQQLCFGKLKNMKLYYPNWEKNRN